MLAKDLITELQKYPPDTLITLAHYEFGFVVVTQIQPVRLAPLQMQRDDGATHIFADAENRDGSPVNALCLGDLEPSLCYPGKGEKTPYPVQSAQNA